MLTQKILTLQPDYFDYDFEEEVCFNDSFKERVIIYGNSHFKSFGDNLLLSIVKEDYYDEENGYDYDVFEELEKVTGKKWETTSFKGYNQGDWQKVYYAVEDVDKEELEFLENFYMGKIDCFTLQEDEDLYTVYIPHSIVWKGKQAICEYLGIIPNTTKIMIAKGQRIVYDYEELE